MYAGNNMIVQSEGHYKKSCRPKPLSYDKMKRKKLLKRVVARFW